MEHNSIVNRYLSDNERYADLINGCEFAGEQVIAPEDLSEADTQVSTLIQQNGKSKNRNRGKTKYRDIIRKLAFGVNFMVIGIENQEEVHYLMPLRTMEYDVREYARQVAAIRKKVRRKEKLTAAEFLSGFTKEDRLHPCVTFVLYYGDDWDGGCELHDLLDFTNIPEQLKALVNNYKIHLIEIKKIQDTGVFRTDLKQVFDFIRYSKDKQKLRELVENDDTYQCLDEDAYDMVALYTNSTELMEQKNHNKKGNGVNMCQAIKEMLQDERAEGHAEGRAEGHAEGRAEGRTEGHAEGQAERMRQDIMKIMKNLQMTAEQAMDVLEIPEEERSKYS